MTAPRIAAVVSVLLLPAVVAAQGLGDVASREREKRAKQEGAKKAGTKVFTNEDLAQGPPPGSAGAGEAAASAPAEGGGDSREPAPREDRLAEMRPYLEAVQAAQARLTQLESRIQELRAKLNPMSGSYIYGATGSNSLTEEADSREELSRSEGELTAARQAVVAANQALQEFRRGRPSLPPVAQ